MKLSKEQQNFKNNRASDAPDVKIWPYTEYSGNQASAPVQS